MTPQVNPSLPVDPWQVLHLMGLCYGKGKVSGSKSLGSQEFPSGPVARFQAFSLWRTQV